MKLAIETKRDTVGVIGLTLKDKVKLTLIKCYGSVPMQEVVDSAGGHPTFLGTAEWIKERILEDYPEVLIDKLDKDARKAKPRFHNNIKLCEAQIKGEIQSMFNSKDRTLWVVNDELYHEDISRMIYAFSPNGIEYYFDSTIDYFMDGMTLEEKGYTPEDIVAAQARDEREKEEYRERKARAASAELRVQQELKAMPQSHTIDGYVYTISHKEKAV